MNDKILREHLVKLLKGGQAFVTAEQALKNVKPGLRNKQPGKNIHSVWENLEHMRIAQEDILKYSLDAEWKSPAWPEGCCLQKKIISIIKSGIDQFLHF